METQLVRKNKLTFKVLGQKERKICNWGRVLTFDIQRKMGTEVIFGFNEIFPARNQTTKSSLSRFSPNFLKSRGVDNFQGRPDPVRPKR